MRLFKHLLISLIVAAIGVSGGVPAVPVGGLSNGGHWSATIGTSAPVGQTLLHYMQGAGSATYVLSGQTLDIYSSTPLDVISWGTGGWSTSTVSYAAGNVTVAAPNAQTNLTPAITNIFVVSGCGWPAVTGNCLGSFVQTMYNAEPNAWDDLAQGAQSQGAIVDLLLWVANPAGNGNCPWPNVLTSGNGTYTALMSGIDAIAASAKVKLTRPFILVPFAEMNTTGSINATTGSLNNTWMGINACSTGVPSSNQVAQLAQEIAAEFIADGVTNFLFMDEPNGGYGNYGWGFPCSGHTSIGNDCATGVVNTFFDLAALDTNYHDASAASFLAATGLPWGLGSFVICYGGLCPTQNAINLWSYGYSGGVCTPSGSGSLGLECMLQDYGSKLGFDIWWGQKGNWWSINTQQGAVAVMSTFPNVSVSNLPTFSSAGGFAGG
jgi:hypothetical protein